MDAPDSNAAAIPKNGGAADMIGILAQRLEASARENPARTALLGDTLKLSYAEFLTTAEMVAMRLKEMGVKPDGTVLVRFSNHPLDFIALFGIWLSGAVAVPVHRTAPPEVRRSIQAKAKAAFDIDLVDVANIPGAIKARSDGTLQPRGLLRGAAIVIFTSGSTGAPKGVVLTHKAFAGKLDQHQSSYEFSPNDRVLLVLNNTFSFGVWLSLLALSHGAMLVVPSKFSPGSFLEILAARVITRVGVVPTMVRATFAGLKDSELNAYSSNIRAAGALKDVYIGGEALALDLSIKLREFISPARLYDGYGLTETATGDSLLSPEEYSLHPTSIGRCMPHIKYRIVNDSGEACAPGVPGELQIDTPYIMAGYLDDPELTEEAFDGHWFRTGDVAIDEGGGFLRIVGRNKELIVRGGNKITPLEVELALCKCKGVGSAMVAGVADPVLGQRIYALIVPTAGGRLDANKLRSELLGRLEKYKVPDKCYVTTVLPTGRTGKLDRQQLQAVLLSDHVQLLAGWADPEP